MFFFCFVFFISNATLNALSDFTPTAKTIFTLEVPYNRMVSLGPSATNAILSKLRYLDIAVNSLCYVSHEMFTYWRLLAYLYIDYYCMEMLETCLPLLLKRFIVMAITEQPLEPWWYII